MSLKLNERYPGRFNNPSADYPQGSFKNRTAPGAKDGSYLEKDWANDKEGFFQSLLSAAGITANGTVDKVGASQYYTAMMQRITSSIPTFGTAALANLTTSSTDTTAGRVTKVGDFGAGRVVIETANANNCVAPGFYATSAAALNNPGVGGCYMFVNGSADASGVVQFAFEIGSGRMSWRSLSSSVWSAWRTVPSDVSAFMLTLLSRTTAAAARTDLGVPAGTDKQMCGAWVNFNGTGTVTIRNSYNVLTVTDLGVGQYRANFTEALNTPNFAPNVSFSYTEAIESGAYLCKVGARSAAMVEVITQQAAANNYVDMPLVSISVSGGK